MQTLNSPRGQGLTYRPSIDGLRAVAVIPVVLFHCGLPIFSSGFVGVDIFFVISGFLVTSIIRKQLEANTFSFRSFWKKRIKRLFPAFATVVIATLVAVYFLVFTGEWKSIATQAQWSLALMANVKMMRLGGDYWGPSAEASPFLHFWSLAVEEHFYLIHPLLLFLGWKYFPNYVGKALVLSGILSFVGCVLVTHYYPLFAFYLLPFRAWEMLLGGIVAIYPLSHRLVSSSTIANTVSFLGVILIIWSFYGCSSNGFPGYQALLPTIGTATLLAVSSSSSLVNSLLSTNLLVSVGKLSYSIYLWHWPIIVIAKSTFGEVPITTVLLLTLFLSVITYFAVERRFRYRRSWISVNLGYACLCVVLIASLSRGSRTYDTSFFDDVAWHGQLYDNAPNQTRIHAMLKERMHGISCPIPQSSDEASFRDQGIVRNYGGLLPEVVVFGDSHGLMWCHVLDEICRKAKKTVSFFAANGTTPIIVTPIVGSATTFFSPKEKADFDSARLELVLKAKPKVIVVASLWMKYDSKELNDLSNFLNLLRRNCDKVIVVEQPPPLSIGDNNALQYASYLRAIGGDAGLMLVPIESHEGYRQRMEEVRRIAQAESCQYVRVAERLIRNEQAIIAEESTLYYIDDDHLSSKGSFLYFDIFSRLIEY